MTLSQLTLFGFFRWRQAGDGTARRRYISPGFFVLGGVCKEYLSVRVFIYFFRVWWRYFVSSPLSLSFERGYELVQTFWFRLDSSQQLLSTWWPLSGIASRPAVCPRKSAGTFQQLRVQVAPSRKSPIARAPRTPLNRFIVLLPSIRFRIGLYFV